jgi:signal peptidase II
LIYFIIAALIFLVDQIAKYFITLHLTEGAVVQLIPGIISLTRQNNTGAAFSFLPDMRWVLVAVTGILIILIILGMIKYKDKLAPIGMLALAAVLGGAVSHLFDRAILGFVVDYLVFDFVQFAVMDIADWFITIGGIVFCVWYVLHSAKHDDLRKEFMFGKRKKADPEIEQTETEEEHTSSTPAEDDGGADVP